MDFVTEITTLLASVIPSGPPNDQPTLTLVPTPTMPDVEVTEATSLVSDGVTATATPIGILYEDGGAKSIILIAVLLATLLVFLCIALVLRFMMKHKGSYHTREDKEGDWGTSLAPTALRGSESFEEQLDEGEKEYYI